MPHQFWNASNSTNEQVSVSDNRSKSSSTQHHRHVQRANGMSEVLGAALSTLSVAAIIPTKVAQTLFSGHAFFTPKLKPIERFAHGIQASLAISQLICVMMLFYKGNECHGESEKESLCKSMILLDLLYQGTLLVGWLPSEALNHIENSRSSNPVAVDRLNSNELSSITTLDAGNDHIIDPAAEGEEEERSSLSMV